MIQSLAVRARGAVRTGWLLVGTTLAALVLAEGCGRIAFWCKDAILGSRAPAGASVPSEASTPCLREALKVKLQWQPYTYWRGTRFRGECVTIEDDGLRCTWQPPASDSGAPVIAMFGGSTMWGMRARGRSRFLSSTRTPAGPRAGSRPRARPPRAPRRPGCRAGSFPPRAARCRSGRAPVSGWERPAPGPAGPPGRRRLRSC